MLVDRLTKWAYAYPPPPPPCVKFWQSFITRAEQGGRTWQKSKSSKEFVFSHLSDTSFPLLRGEWFLAKTKIYFHLLQSEYCWPWGINKRIKWLASYPLCRLLLIDRVAHFKLIVKRHWFSVFTVNPRSLYYWQYCSRERPWLYHYVYLTHGSSKLLK